MAETRLTTACALSTHYRELIKSLPPDLAEQLTLEAARKIDELVVAEVPE